MPVNKFYNIDFMPVELKHGWMDCRFYNNYEENRRA